MLKGMKGSRLAKYAAYTMVAKFCIFGVCAGTAPAAKGRIIDGLHRPQIEENLDHFWGDGYIGKSIMKTSEPFRKAVYLAVGE
jgi:hypothetical protein